VIYVGSFSKTLSPSLRMGFVAAPPSLVPALCAAKRVADSHGQIELQLAVAELVEDGLLARHVRRIQRVYRDRRDRLVHALGRELGNEIELLPASAGLHVTALLAPGLDESATVSAARRADVVVEPLTSYYQGRGRAGLVLGYGLIPATKIDEGIRRIADAIRRAKKLGNTGE
jgi:GntR family transcriptional regulator/MocR family aminotransferase